MGREARASQAWLRGLRAASSLRPDGSERDHGDDVVVLLAVADETVAQGALEALEREFAEGRVTQAATLAEAASQIESGTPDLVVVSTRWQDGTANVLLSPADGGPNLPFVALGPAADEVAWLDKGERGVLDFVISKPPFLARVGIHARRALREWGHILARREAELAISERDGYYRRLIEHTQDIITILGSDFTIHYQSPSIERLLGYSPRTLEGVSALELIHPDDRARVLEAMSEAQRDPASKQRVEYRFRHSNGSWRVLESVGCWGEGTLRADQQVVTSRDITARVAAETERSALEVQLHHAQKLETMGTLAGGIAHDFNNILTSLFGFAGLVLDGLAPDSPAYHDMSQVLRAAERAKDLVRRILTFSRQVEPERRPVDLVEVIDEALSLARASLPSSITIEAHLDPESGRALADPSQLHQIVLNLCANAAHAMQEGGGVLDVSLRCVERSESTSMRVSGLQPGRYLELVVTDTGHGMDEATLERIFEPFFTTKSKGEGTGLGLAVVHGIVASHGGSITATSALGRGTRFTVLLPASRSAPAPPLVRPMPSTGHERILFVDDEADILVPIQRLLMAAGYEVELATSGAQALTIFASEPARFELVITDRTMPTMSGIELAQALHAARPDLPIVLVSGFGATLEDLPRGVVRAALAKPFTFQELSTTIRRVLDEGQ